MSKLGATIDNLADEMGSALFTDVVDFDMEISESQYDYKVLMGRRFFVLHEGLKPVIEDHYGEDLNITGSFVTNLSVVLKDLEGRRVLIVDDTLLHGRAIKKTADNLIACGCKEKDIHANVYLRNGDANIIEPSLQNLPDYKRVKNANMWRHVSSKIVDTFMASGWPYMYYLPYYETTLDSDRADRINSFLKSQKLSDNAVTVQKKHGISSYLYHETHNLNICRETLIRVYKYDRLNKLIIVPYAYLKPLSCGQIADAFKVFAGQEFIRYDGNGDFTGNPDVLAANDLKAQYAYSLLTYICSLLQGSLFLQSLGLKDWKYEKAVETSSLGCDVRLPEDGLEGIILNLNQIPLSEKMSLPLEPDDDVRTVIGWLMADKEQSAIREMDIDYFLDHYLKLSSRLDEELAAQNKERMCGLRIEQIFPCVHGREKIWEKVNEVIDTGRATISSTCYEVNSMKYVDSLLYAGEQNHACNEENLAVLIYPLLQYEMYCRDQQVPEDIKKDVKSQIVEAILNQTSGLRARISQQEIRDLKEESFVRDHEAYYFDKYPMFMQDPEVQHGMSVEKEYEYM